METLFFFYTKISIGMIILYLGYQLIFRIRNNFRLQRIYLLLTIILPFVLAFNPISLRTYFSPIQTEVIAEIKQSTKPGNLQTVTFLENKALSSTKNNSTNSSNLFLIYLIVGSILLLRIVSGLLRLLYLINTSGKAYICNSKVYLTDRIKGSTSIFGFIFLHSSLQKKDNLEQVILHEKIHVSQYHSIDILVVELFAAALWFNPVVWLLRRSLQQIHEYLADEGVLNSGVNRLEYQKLLIDHITEDSLVLSSGFKSSTKKRLFMMSKVKSVHDTNSVIYALISILFTIVLIISCINPPTDKKDQKGKVVFAAVAPTRMNVLYLGADNPINVAVSDYSMSEIKAETDNGKLIQVDGGNYIAQPERTGTATISVFASGNLINTYQFRVKQVPDPAASVGGKKGGSVTRDVLLNAGKLSVIMENFDFDLQFTIKSFSLSTAVEGFYKEEVSTSGEFTPSQINLIKKQPAGSKLFFENIVVTGPDGTNRRLPSIVFKLE